MEKIHLTDIQKRIFILAGIITLSFFIFAVLIYIPANRKMVQLKTEFTRLEEETKRLKKYVGEGQSLEQIIVSLNNRLDKLHVRFPEKEEVVLRELSALASGLGIEVLSIKPDRKKVLQSINEEQVAIKDCVVQEMSVAINMKTSYKVLGEFIRRIKEDFPVFIKVDSVQMEKVSDDYNSNILNVNMNVDSYLINKVK